MENYNQRIYNTFPSYPELDSQSRHSGPGIASFIISLVAMLGYIFGIVLVLVAAVNILDGVDVLNILDEELEQLIEGYLFQEGGAIAGALLIILSGFLNLISLILGIIGLSIKNRKKIFAKLGTIFSIILLLLIILLIAWASIQ
jgi:hypothetical protein